MMDRAHKALITLDKYRGLLWATLVLSYAYYVNMAPVLLPFSAGALFGLNTWENLVWLYARNIFVVGVLFTLLVLRPAQWRRYDMIVALLCLTTSQALFIYSDLAWVALLLRLLMSMGLALALLALADLIAVKREGGLPEWGAYAVSFSLMHFITDFLCYLFYQSVSAIGWLLSYRLSIGVGLAFCATQLFGRSAWLRGLFEEREAVRAEPLAPWRQLLTDKTVRLALLWVICLSIPMMYVSSEMGLYSLYHLQKHAVHSIVVVRGAFGVGWLLGFLIWFAFSPGKRGLPYCITVCSSIMAVTAIITIFLQPLTLATSLCVMFFMGLAFSGVLLAFQLIRLRFKPYDAHRLVLAVFIALSLAGVFVSLLALALIVVHVYLDGGFKFLHLDHVFHGLMFSAPFTSLLAVLLSFYIAPFKSLTLPKEDA